MTNSLKHVAIIMDGNRRWAEKRSLSTKKGHSAGAKNLLKIVDATIKFGISYMTVYAFSSENWNRPQEEVNDLMAMLEYYLDNDLKDLHKKNVRIKVIGNNEKLSEKLKEKIKNLEILTQNNNTLQVNVAFSYGGRQEIVDCTQKIASKVSEGLLKVSDIDEAVFGDALYDNESPDPDLMIRTGGDYRISNFLLWQLAYTELYFSEVLWPDFDEAELKKAIDNFNKRKRRYGKR